MNDIEKKLFKCFEIIDVHFFDNFEDDINKRIKFQKFGLLFAYFFGLRIGEFSLYIHGPYNSELTEVGYKYARHLDEYKNFATTLNFADKAVQIIETIKNYLFDKDINFIEVYITYFYLLNKRNLDVNKAKEKLIEIKQDLMQNPSIEDYFNNIIEMHQQLKEQIHNISPHLSFV